jgi:membrane protein implicated in regulation of membrane protease activity
VNTETIWAVVGLILVIADVVFGTFFILFVGAGALLTALLIWMGVLPAADPTWHWVVFAVLSTLGLVLFRKKVVALFGRGGEDKYDEHRGQKVTVAQSIPENGMGRAMYRGAEWPAKTVDGTALDAGKSAVIRNNDGITLEIEAI